MRSAHDCREFVVNCRELTRFWSKLKKLPVLPILMQMTELINVGAEQVMAVMLLCSDCMN